MVVDETVRSSVLVFRLLAAYVVLPGVSPTVAKFGEHGRSRSVSNTHLPCGTTSCFSQAPRHSQQYAVY
jgi:hypothetical protein